MSLAGTGEAGRGRAQGRRWLGEVEDEVFLDPEWCSRGAPSPSVRPDWAVGGGGGEAAGLLELDGPVGREVAAVAGGCRDGGSLGRGAISMNGEEAAPTPSVGS